MDVGRTIHNRPPPRLTGLVGKKKKEEEEKLRCPTCGMLIDLNSLKPIFKKEYVGNSGRLDVPTEMLLHGGWLGKTRRHSMSKVWKGDRKARLGGWMVLRRRHLLPQVECECEPFHPEYLFQPDAEVMDSSFQRVLHLVHIRE